MAVVVFRAASITVTMQNTFRKQPGGVIYWRMRVPKDLCSHYPGKTHLIKSLKSSDAATAAPQAAQLTAEHQAYWATLRSPEVAKGSFTPKQTRDAAKARLLALGLQPGTAARNPEGWWKILNEHERTHGPEFMEERHVDPENGADAFLTPVDRELERLFKEGEGSPEITISQARDTYFRLHEEGEEARFQRDTNLPVTDFMTVAGDLPLGLYTKQHINAYRDWMAAKGNKSKTIERRFKALSAVFNMAKREHGLTCSNPFQGVIIARVGKDITPRKPFTMEELRTVSTACRRADDDMRHIISMQLDTGARLGEIVGLRIDDVFLDHEVPHILIRDHRSLGRRVKTEVSNRRTPLVGEALWGARRAVEAARKRGDGGGWLFPRYAEDGNVKSNHASAALNKWLKTLPGVTKTTHSFRHLMRDRMREADIREDIRDAIDGHGTKSVGEQYGSGHSLKKLRDELVKVVIPENDVERNPTS